MILPVGRMTMTEASPSGVELDAAEEAARGSCGEDADFVSMEARLDLKRDIIKKVVRSGEWEREGY